MSRTIMQDGQPVEIGDADYAAQFPAAPPQPPAPRLATGKQVRYALNDLGADIRKAFEAAAAAGTQAMQDWWGWTDPIVESAPKLARLCKAAGITPAQLMDKATAE